MMMKKEKDVKIVVFLFMLIVYATQPLTGQAQRREQARTDFVFFEALSYPHTDSTLTRVEVLYRVDEQFFVSIRTTDAAANAEYVRRGEIMVELVDSLGVSKAREINRFELESVSTDSEATMKQWYQGRASFTLPPGRYSLIVEVDDRESERHFIDRSKTFIAPRLSVGSAALSSNLIVKRNPVAEEPYWYAPENFGGNIRFGETATLFLMVPTTVLADGSISITQTIKKSMPSDELSSKIIDTSIVAGVINGAEMSFAGKDGELKFSISQGTSPFAALLIPIPSEKLTPGNYELAVKIGTGEKARDIHHKFRMIWPDMPLSLLDLDGALDALRYITSEQQLDSLKRGGRDAKLRSFEEFWRLKDPTPETAYNEVMVEFYRRADYALRHFSSFNSFDGMKSDRGRIYILYGPPTRTDRALDPVTGFREVWIYERLSKQFVFTDQTRSGKYVLTSTKPL